MRCSIAELIAKELRGIARRCGTSIYRVIAPLCVRHSALIVIRPCLESFECAK